MATRNLLVRISADVEQAKKAFKEVEGDEKGGGIKGISGAVAGLNTLLTAGVITGIGYAVQKAFGDYSNYVKEVDDLSASLGITVEEADGLLGSMKMFDVSSPAMIGAFRRMSTDGIEPTLENLGKILQAYDAMPAGAEKGVEAMRILGEQGIADLLPWWENLSAYEKDHLAFLEYGPEVTRDMAAENDAFRDSVGGLTDAWSDLKNELLGGLIPTLTSVLDYITNAVAIATVITYSFSDFLIYLNYITL